MGPTAEPKLQADWLMPMATPGAPGALSFDSMMAVANPMLRAAVERTSKDIFIGGGAACWWRERVGAGLGQRWDET